MELKEGYKMTELGVIPEDWEVKTLKDLSKPVRGGSPRPAGDKRYFNGNHIPWLTVASLTNIPASKMLVNITDSYLTEAGAKFSRELRKGTVIIANSGATLGVAKILAINACANDGIAALLDLDEKVHAAFIVHYINSQTKTLREIIATGNGQPNLNTDLIGNIFIATPASKAEQTAIATALSDMDALITSLEQLIAKKRSIKQGVMQELLTGKRRLPGFGGDKYGYKMTDIGPIPDDWEVIELRECLDLLTDFEANGSFETVAANVKIFDKDNYSWYVRATDLEKESLMSAVKFVDKQSYKFLKKTMLFGEEVLITKRGEIGKVYYFKMKTQYATLAPNMYLLKLNKKVVPYFVYLYFKSKTGNRLLVEKNASSTLGALYKEDVKSLPIILPSISEQSTIAATFIEIDAEISILEQKLTKLQLLKQGMMQNLLTGKIRLI